MHCLVMGDVEIHERSVQLGSSDALCWPITLLLDSWLGITTENPGSHYKYLAYLGLDNSFLFLPRSLCGDVCGHYSNGKPTQPVETCWAKCFLIWTISIPQHMCHYHNRHHHYHCHHNHRHSSQSSSSPQSSLKMTSNTHNPDLESTPNTSTRLLPR